MNANNNRFQADGDDELDRIYNPPFIAAHGDRPSWPKGKSIEFPKLFPTHSHWIQAFRHRLDHFVSSNDLPSEADVVIIGSGLTGCSAAFHILQKNPELKVVLVEARAFCSGATGRNGGHLARPDGFDFQSEWNALGESRFMAARAFFEQNRAATLEHIHSRKLAKQVDLTWTGGVQIFGSQAERDTAISDLEFMEAAGIKHKTVILSKEEMAERMECENLYGGFYSPSSGSLWPRKFCAAIMDEVLDANQENFKLYTNTCATAVNAIESNGSCGSRWEIVTSRGRLKARSVLHATNAWLCALLPELLHTRDEVLPDKELVIAARPAPNPYTSGTWKCNVMASNGFHYLAQMPQDPDDDRENVIIYGLSEEMNNCDDSTLVETAQDDLADMTAFLGHAFPSKFTVRDSEGRITSDCIENIWAGLIGRTVDGSVVAGPVHGKKGQYTAAGFNGAGMSMCYLTGAVMSDMITWELRQGQDGQHTAWKAPSYYPDWFLRHLEELDPLPNSKI